MNVEVEIEPGAARVLAEEPRFVSLVDRRLQALALADELAADIDVAGVGGHREAGDQAALGQEVRVMPHDLAVLAGAGLGLVGVDHEVMRPAVRLLRHERPLEAGREAGAAAPALPRRLHFIDDRVAALREDRLGVVPGAAHARPLEAPVMEAVEVLEDAILVRKHHSRLVVVWSLELSPTGGLGTPASLTFAAAPGFLAASSVSGCAAAPERPLVA